MKKRNILLFVLFSIFKALPVFAQPSVTVSSNKDLMSNPNITKEQQLEYYLDLIKQNMYTDTSVTFTILNDAIK